MAWLGQMSRTFAYKFVPKIISRFEFKLPDRFKGTMIEKWAQYWKNLCIDYKEVTVEAAESARQKPVNAIFTCTGLGFMAYCIHSNPDERTFRDKLLFNTNEMAVIGESVRNPLAVSHLKFLEKCYNAGVIRRLNLGIVSFVWVSDYDKSSGLYEAHCDYLEPRYFTFYKRIIDIGFLGQWWLLRRSMIDFDVNPLEFEAIERHLNKN